MGISVLEKLGQAAGVAGEVVGAVEQKKRQAMLDAIAQLKAERESRSASILDALHRAQTTKALQPTSEPPVVTVGPDGKRVYTPRSQAIGMQAPEPIEPTNVIIGSDGKPTYATRSESVGKEAPKPREGASEVVVQGASGGPVIVDKKTRTATPVTESGGEDRLRMQPPANITTGHVENIQRKANIEDALAKLKAHPTAVGLLRAVPDDVNQRIDPKGVSARAALADIGSLIIHDRSGAAVTVSEYPRLKPFVPKVTDTYETVVKKLDRMAKIIDEENLAMTTAYPALTKGGADSRTPDQKDWDDAVKLYGEAKVLKEFGPRP